MFTILGRVAVSHPWKIAAGWLALAVVLFVTTPPWESKAHDEDIRFLPERCASVRGYHLMGKAFPKELDCSRITFALERAGTPLGPRDFALVDDLVADLEQLRKTDDLRIGKIYSYKEPLIGRRLTSSDGLCTLIQVSLATPYLALQTREIVDRAEAALQKRIAEANYDAPELLTTGAAGIGRDLTEAGGNSLERTTLATVLLVIGILLLVYRAPLLALVPLITIALAVGVAMRLLALLTQIPGVQLVNVSQIFAVVLLYGAGTDYCLFLISRYREELFNGQDTSEAIRRSIRAVGAALAASAGTVICGLSLMGFAEFAKVRCAGPAIALALTLALVASLTLTPALLKILGRAAFWPLKVPQRPGREVRQDDEAGECDSVSSFWEWVSHKVVARPLLVWGVSVLILLPLAILGLFTTPICKPTGELAPTSASVRGMDVIQRHFTAGETGPVTIMLASTLDWGSSEGRQYIGRVTEELCKIDNVAEVRSLVQPLGKMVPVPVPRPESRTNNNGGLLGGLLRGLRGNVVQALSQASDTAREFYVGVIPEESGKRYVARLDLVMRSDPFDTASTATLEQIESWLAQELPKIDIPMGWVDAESYGVTVYSRDMAMVTNSDRLRVNVLVMAGIFIILVMLIRHIWVAAYLLVTVLLSYFATLGATTLVGSYISGYPLGQLDWRVPFFLFVILAAVGEDYNILLVSRILQERKRRGIQEGIRVGLSRTGGTITACGIIMAGTFATLTLGGLNTLIQIGFALAFGVLIDTFIVRPFLVPAFLLLFWKDKKMATGTVSLPLPEKLRESA